MSILWGDMAGDGIANNREVYSHPVGRFETAPRSYYRDVFTTVTATTYLAQIFLEKGTNIGNIGCYVATAAVTPTSSWMGLWTHPTNQPNVRLTIAGQPAPNDWNPVYTSEYTVSKNSTTTLTLGQTGSYTIAAWPKNLVGRAITGSNIPASTWVTAQPTNTTLTMSAAATITNTSLANVGQFMVGRYNLGYTTNGATGAIAAGAYVRPLTPSAITIPASGLYLLGCTFAATTMPIVVARTGSTSIPVGFYNDAPVWAQSFVSGTSQNTAPGINPITAGTQADMRTQIYMYVTA